MADHTGIYVDARIAFVVAVGETLQDSVDLLGFFGQFHLHEQLPDSHVDGIAEEGELAHIAS